MKTPRLAKAVGYIDDDLITAEAENTKKTKRIPWLKWGAFAACFALAVAAVTVVPMMRKDQPDIAIADHVRPYKDVTVMAGESGYYVWPWEDKTVDEKYTQLDVEGKTFCGRQKKIGAELVGDLLGTYELRGYDDYSDGLFYEEFDVYEIAGISPDELVAVHMDNQYYVFISENWNPPETFGEVLDRYDLQNTVVLQHFSVYERGKEDRYFNLSSDDDIWELLSGCGSAKLVDPTDWAAHDRDYLSFTVTSESLGVYKNAMYITEDGYLWTNVFNGALLYHIGADTAERMIDHVLENAVPSEFLPYMHSLTGTITEIGDGYILLDDSVMCSDPEDGIVYQIVTTDPKLGRIFKAERLRVGDTVQVQYTDYVDLAANAVIDSAAAISEAQIIDGCATVPE